MEGRRNSITKRAAPHRLPPKDQIGKQLRTRRHLADRHGQFDTYEVEVLVAERLAKGPAIEISEKQWYVHWKCYPVSARTWEPLEEFIPRFNEEREQQEQKYEQQR